MRVPLPYHGRRYVAALAFAALCGVSGCTLIQQGWMAFSGKQDPQQIPEVLTAKPAPGSTENTVLKPLAPSRSTIQVEIVFVERTADDPLLSDLLWRDLDQVGALDPAMREGLKRNGFRIGISSSSPPVPLQKLLGLTAEIPDHGSAEDARKLVGRRIALTSGSETDLQTSQNFETCTVAAWNGEGHEKEDFKNARCLFKMRAQRVQDGWAKLEFVPEVHHGDMVMRQIPTQDGWTLKSTQLVKQFSSQRFELTLNQGEMAVIASNIEGPADTSSPTLGQQFFLGNEKGDNVRRVLIVRLAELGRTEGVLQRSP
jgi:hypothetical protein